MRFARHPATLLFEEQSSSRQRFDKHWRIVVNSIQKEEHALATRTRFLNCLITTSTVHSLTSVRHVLPRPQVYNQWRCTYIVLLCQQCTSSIIKIYFRFPCDAAGDKIIVRALPIGCWNSRGRSHVKKGFPSVGHDPKSSAMPRSIPVKKTFQK